MPRARWISVLAVCLVVFAVGARAAIATRTPQRLTVPPLEDDSYYEQGYARALWYGSVTTLNGIDRGNAFHPLYPLLCAPLHGLAGGDRVLALRYVTILNVLLFGATLWVIRRSYRVLAGDDATAGGAVMAGVGLYAAHSVAYLVDMNLMQTGVQLLAVWMVVLKTLSMEAQERRRDVDFIQLGLLQALACAARIDFALVVFGSGLAYASAWSRRELTLRRFVWLCAPSAALILGWLVISKLAVGSWMPTGGRANGQALTLEGASRNLGRAFSVLALMLAGLPHSSTPDAFWAPWWIQHPWSRPLLGSVAVAVGLGVFGRTLWRTPAGRRDLRTTSWALAPLAAGIATLVLAYVARFGASYFFMRYFAVALPLMGCIAFVCIKRALSAGQVYRVAGLLVVQGALFGFLQVTVTQMGSSGWWDTAQVAIARSRPETWIASMETGVLGYYHERTINLDGKTNLTALEARERGDTTAYLVSSRATVVVDRWGHFFTDGLRFAGDDPRFQHAFALEHALPYLWVRRPTAEPDPRSRP